MRPMTRLSELASLIRSKNAGPFELTFDIMFEDPDTYRSVLASGVISTAAFSELFGVRDDLVRIYAYDPAFAIKVTIPRPIVSGSIGDNDVYGCQQFGPLADLELTVGGEGP
jgi:Domain of unknown function (DUF4387)